MHSSKEACADDVMGIVSYASSRVESRVRLLVPVVLYERMLSWMPDNGKWQVAAVLKVGIGIVHTYTSYAAHTF